MLNCFGNFQNEELVKKHKNFCKNSNYTDYNDSDYSSSLVLPKKNKTVLNKITSVKMEVPANILKELFGSKAVYQNLKVFLILRQCLQNYKKLD